MVLIYTTSFCPDCWRVKRVLKALQVPYQERNVNLDEDALDDVRRIVQGWPRVPTLVFADGTVMVDPDPTDLLDKLTASEYPR